MATGTESRLPESAPRARAGRRWRRWLLVAGGVVVVALVAAATYVSRLQPLAEGAITGLEDSRPPTDDDGFLVTYRDRTLTRGLLSLRNDGRVAVRVERVGAARVAEGGEWHGLVDFRPERNGLNPPDDNAYDAPPFRAFTLRPGEGRSVSVALWLDNCEHNGPGTTMTLTAVPVTYRVFGMRRTQLVRLGTPWSVTAPAASCPR